MTNLRHLRTERNLTREALAQKAGLNSQTIAAHEYGVTSDVFYSVATKLAEALGVPVEDLFLARPTGERIKHAEEVES